MLLRTRVFLTIACICIATAFLMHMFPLHEWENLGGKYLSFGDVRGIAAQKEGVLYTLNFEQQKELIQLLNQLVP